jgi:hypothetical protein
MFVCNKNPENELLTWLERINKYYLDEGMFQIKYGWMCGTLLSIEAGKRHSRSRQQCFLEKMKKFNIVG